MDSIDMIFDMLLEPGQYDSLKISKYRFKDYVLSICGNTVREQDIDILLKTNSFVKDRDYIELSAFRSMFEVPVAEARQRKAEAKAELEKSYQVAQRYFQQSMNTNQMNASQKMKTGVPGMDLTFTQGLKNSMLDQSINQRFNETAGFDQNPTN